MINLIPKENSNVLTSVDLIISKSMESPENRKLLTEMFPNVFELDKPFCAVGDILIRKGKKAFYTLTWLSTYELGIMNLQYGKSWDNRLKVNKMGKESKESQNLPIYISRKEFELLSKHYFSEFVVLPKESLIALYDK